MYPHSQLTLNIRHSIEILTVASSMRSPSDEIGRALNALRSGVCPTYTGLTPNKFLVSYKLDLLTNSDQWNIDICTEY